MCQIYPPIAVVEALLLLLGYEAALADAEVGALLVDGAKVGMEGSD